MQAIKLPPMLLLLVLPFVVRAQFTFTTNNGAITITGYTGPGGNVMLPSTTNGFPVTSIGAYAFANCVILTDVTIPYSFTSIGNDAFVGCTSLTNVTIGNSVTNIGDEAFLHCPNLTSVTIPNSVTSIGLATFSGCGLTSVTIGNSVTSIGAHAFGSCNLTSVTIPNSVTNIGEWAFDSCINLTNVTIGSGFTRMGYYPFSWCTNLTSIRVDTNNLSYSSVAGILFNRSQSVLIAYPEGLKGSYTIPNSVTNIGVDAFFYCISLTNVTVPKAVTSIADYAFTYCYNLTTAFFLGNAPSGGNKVFYGEAGTAFYLPGTTGWGSTFGGWPTAMWYQPQPMILGSGYGLGVYTNGFCFTISWATNIPVVVEACTNLFNPVWTPVATNTLTNGSTYFNDPQRTNYPGRFYRLRSP